MHDGCDEVKIRESPKRAHWIEGDTVEAMTISRRTQSQSSNNVVGAEEMC